MRMEIEGEVAVLRMQAGKANAMSGAMLSGLARLLDELEGSGAGAAVITGAEGFFSAGLDLPSLVALDRPSMRRFIGLFAEVMERVFALPRPVVAAVNGHAIAGGCVLALAADVRLLAAGQAKMGLSEVRLGIGLPAVVIESLRCQLPPPALVPVALEGRLFPPDEALAVGLVHEVTPPAELEARARARARELAAIPGGAFAQVKRALRGPALEAMEARREEESERWLDTWFSAAGQRLLGETAARLGGGK